MSVSNFRIGGEAVWRLLVNMCAGAHCVEFPAAEGAKNGEQIILVHGLLHRGAVMYGFARLLAGHGYRVWVYDYPTTRGFIPEYGERFRRFLITCAAAAAKTHLVTHSMGGLVARHALGEDGLLSAERRGKLIFLGVPHQGSPAADFWVDALPRTADTLVRPLRSLCSKNSDDGALSRPEGWCVGSVAGLFDRKVPPERSSYPDDDRITVECGHSFMMNNEKVRKQVIFFLKNGFFLEK